MLLLSSTSNTMTGRLSPGVKLRLISSSIPIKLLVLKLRTCPRKFVTSRVTTSSLKRLKIWVQSCLWFQLFTPNSWKTVTGANLKKSPKLCSITTPSNSTSKISSLLISTSMKTPLTKSSMLPKRKPRLKRSSRTLNKVGASKSSNSPNTRKPRFSLLLIIWWKS